MGWEEGGGLRNSLLEVFDCDALHWRAIPSGMCRYQVANPTGRG